MQINKMAYERAVSYYQPEIANIRFFMREPRTIIEWQDWLRRRMPKLARHTVKIPPSAVPLGQGWTDLACRYTDLLTICCMLGMVKRERGAVTVYQWIGE